MLVLVSVVLVLVLVLVLLLLLLVVVLRLLRMPPRRQSCREPVAWPCAAAGEQPLTDHFGPPGCRMQNDIYDSMAAGVQGAACVVCFMSEGGSGPCPTAVFAFARACAATSTAESLKQDGRCAEYQLSENCRLGEACTCFSPLALLVGVDMPTLSQCCLLVGCDGREERGAMGGGADEFHPNPRTSKSERSQCREPRIQSLISERSAVAPGTLLPTAAAPHTATRSGGSMCTLSQQPSLGAGHGLKPPCLPFCAVLWASRSPAELKFSKQSGVPLVPVMLEDPASGWRAGGWWAPPLRRLSISYAVSAVELPRTFPVLPAGWL